MRSKFLRIMLRNSAYVLSKLILKLSEVLENMLSTDTLCSLKKLLRLKMANLSDLVGFAMTLILHVIRRSQGWAAHFRPLQRQADIFTQKYESGTKYLVVIN